MTANIDSDEFRAEVQKTFFMARRAVVRMAIEKKRMTERDFPLTFMRAAETIDPGLYEPGEQQTDVGLKPLQMSHEQLFEVRSTH
jgi:hypothetical protein